MRGGIRHNRFFVEGARQSHKDRRGLQLGTHGHGQPGGEHSADHGFETPGFVQTTTAAQGAPNENSAGTPASLG